MIGEIFAIVREVASILRSTSEERELVRDTLKHVRNGDEIAAARKAQEAALVTSLKLAAKERLKSSR